MGNDGMKRREFIESLVAGFSIGILDWSAMPVAAAEGASDDAFDAIIIGSGLGGLSCAAALARQGFRALVLEQHDKPGGYATTFKRQGFVFDVSLHSTTIGERNGLHNLIPGFPEIADVEFVPHPHLYRAVFPDHDIRLPQKGLGKYVAMLIERFPAEKAGIEGLFAYMQTMAGEVEKISKAKSPIDMSRLPVNYPLLFKGTVMSWGKMVDARVKDAKCKAIISSLWPYYGLPPATLSPFYYALPTLSYLQGGGHYPKGRSQKISNALATFIEHHGGRVKANTRVERILVKDGAAVGVRTAKGDEYKARVVVSNANAHDTFNKLLSEGDRPKAYVQRLDKLSVSLSSFHVFLGLKKDLIKEVGIKDTEIFQYAGYDHEAAYEAMVKADVATCGFSLTLYDNLYEGYSPPGKNTVDLLTLQGYDFWKPFAEDYFDGEKDAYRAKKEEMADILIDRAEKAHLPGLRAAIEVREVGTPLTNIRYTSNHRGAIYGFDQTMDNAGQMRLAHKTPIKNLFLSGAWTRPGHGYGGVIPSGLECAGEIMQGWKAEKKA